VPFQYASRFCPLLHCDGDWGKNLDYLDELPRAKVVLQFDGRTDMFRAKEIIGDHCCIFGDVPASMLAFGGKQEVSDYCKKLIDVVGKRGGFILAAGCEVAPNTRPRERQGNDRCCEAVWVLLLSVSKNDA